MGLSHPSTGKTVLITGGAGFLGINMVRYLLARGYQAVSLDIAPFNYIERHSITVLHGDIRNPRIVQNAMEGVDFVVHAAAALPRYAPADIYLTDVNGTHNVLHASFQAKVQRVVYISSTAVYGTSTHHSSVESDRLSGIGPYGKAKVKAEDICEEYRQRGLCVPILRPKSFIGPERLGVFSIFYDWAKDGKNFPILGDGRNRYQLLDVEDLCAAIYLTITLPRIQVNDTFNIGATEFVSMKEEYQAVLDYAGYGKRIISLPAKPAIWMLRILEQIGLVPLYKWVYETVATDSFVTVEKAQRKLNWNPQYSNREALIRNFIWYLKNCDSFEGRSGISHRETWNQGVLRLMKMFF